MFLFSEGNPFGRGDLVRVPRAAQSWTGTGRRARVCLPSTRLPRAHEHPRAALKARDGTQLVLLIPLAREQITRPDASCAIFFLLTDATLVIDVLLVVQNARNNLVSSYGGSYRVLYD